MDDALSERDLSFWLALARGPFASATLLSLIAADPPLLGHLFDRRDRAVPDCVSSPLRQYLRAPDWTGVTADLRWHAIGAGAVVTFPDAGYPELLRQIPDPPPLLFVRGRPACLATLQIAVVGTRKPTPDGATQAYRIGAELAHSGVTVTSGLALGIDAQAHGGALDAGAQTVAVLGCGVDQMYPSRNAGLAERIVAAGAVVTEFGVGVPPLAMHFPRRNRIISGLTRGTLVVEAAMRSGSLITAGLAAAHGREVFAMPGSVRNPMAQGCHHLIRQGAKLVTDAGDILEEIRELAHMNVRTRDAPRVLVADVSELDERCRLLLDNIGFGSIAMDELINQTGLAAGITASLLSSLEISGHIEILPGGRIVRR